MMRRSPRDTDLERLIEAQRQKLVHAETADARRSAWYSMKSLIESRSAIQVRRMEIARGLR